jgi:ribonuclease P protein component
LLNKLKKRDEFVELYQSGNSISTKGAIIQYMESNIEEPKLGFTASKKVGSAVYRNKAKRRLKAAIIEINHKSPQLFKPKYKYNFIARYSTIERDFQKLIKDIKYALHQIK